MTHYRYPYVLTDIYYFVFIFLRNSLRNLLIIEKNKFKKMNFQCFIYLHFLL